MTDTSVQDNRYLTSHRSRGVSEKAGKGYYVWSSPDVCEGNG
jgi:hypothetical protein